MTDLSALAREYDGGKPKGKRTAPATKILGRLLSTIEPESVDWLWPGRLPAGKLVVLDGDPGLGKSTLALDIAARVTQGSDFPDGEQSRQSVVLLATAEDGAADTVRPRFDAAGGNAARLIVLDGTMDENGEAGSLTLPGHVAHLQTFISDHELSAGLIIVDPFMAYLGGDVNSRIDHDIRRATAPLAALAEATGATVLLVRHLNKAAGGTAIYRGGESIGIIGAARAGFLVARDPEDDDRRVFAATKSNLSALAPSLGFTLASNGNGAARIQWLGVSEYRADALVAQAGTAEERSALEEAKALLLDELGSGPREAAEVKRDANKAGVSDITLRRARQALGVVVRREGFGKGGAWRWALPGPKPEPDPDDAAREAMREGA